MQKRFKNWSTRHASKMGSGTMGPPTEDIRLLSSGTRDQTRLGAPSSTVADSIVALCNHLMLQLYHVMRTGRYDHVRIEQIMMHQSNAALINQCIHVVKWQYSDVPTQSSNAAFILQ